MADTFSRMRRDRTTPAKYHVSVTAGASSFEDRASVGYVPKSMQVIVAGTVTLVDADGTAVAYGSLPLGHRIDFEARNFSTGTATLVLHYDKD